MNLKINLVPVSTVAAAVALIPAKAVWVCEDSAFVIPSTGGFFAVTGDYGAVDAVRKAVKAKKASGF